MRHLTKLFLVMMFAGSSVAFGQHHHHHPDSTAPVRHADSLQNMEMPRSQHHGAQHMSHAFSRRLPMNRNGSGTAWLPDNSPMFGYMIHTRKWMYMFHGNLFLRYNSQDLFDQGTRGDAKVDAPNWFMAMGQRSIGKRGLLRFGAMLTLDPITVGGAGYPLLYQSGETWKGKPLVDRQHPHDLFSELSIAYTHQFNPTTDAFAYFGYPGEPAFGPVAFMHRPSSLYNPDAPLGHHWQDATHITFGVATVGLRHRNLKLEGSIFTGREPNEERYGFDKPTFDSYSLRLSLNPKPSLALQLSQAWINDVHEIGAREDVRKTTASAIHSVPVGNNKSINSTLVWGFNNSDHHNGAHSLLIESALTLGKTAVYGKYEWVEKTADELLLGSAFNQHRLFGVKAATLGIQQTVATPIDTHLAIGAQASWYPSTKDIAAIYRTNPMAAEVYIRLYPRRMN